MDASFPQSSSCQQHEHIHCTWSHVDLASVCFDESSFVLHVLHTTVSLASLFLQPQTERKTGCFNSYAIQHTSPMQGYIIFQNM